MLTDGRPRGSSDALPSPALWKPPRGYQGARAIRHESYPLKNTCHPSFYLELQYKLRRDVCGRFGRISRPVEPREKAEVRQRFKHPSSYVGDCQEYVTPPAERGPRHILPIRFALVDIFMYGVDGITNRRGVCFVPCAFEPRYVPRLAYHSSQPTRCSVFLDSPPSWPRNATVVHRRPPSTTQHR